MNWMDYREKLGIGFSDEEKFKHFKQKIFNCINVKGTATFGEYFDFCDTTCSKFDWSYSDNSYGHDWDRYESILHIIDKRSDSMESFLAYYIAFMNAREIGCNFPKHDDLKNILCKALENLRIPYEFIEDEDGCFVFPKGAMELDDALVSEPLEWLSKYPSAHKTFVTALKQYNEGTYIRDTADNFRKALEEFLKEFFQNTKNLDNNIKEVGKFLKEKGAENEITSILSGLFNAYNMLNNKIAKHNDKVDARFLEFLMYQTGLFIRMLIVARES